MKTLFSTIFIFLTTLLFAQSPILPLNTPYEQITNNAYLKDTQNQLTPFVGTWNYQQGNIKVTIKFQKVMQYQDSSKKYYYDRLKANYKVEKNGVVVYNNLNQPIDENSSIYGFDFLNGKYSLSYVDYAKCGIRGDAEIWIDANGKLNWSMYMSDPNPYLLDECPEFHNSDFHDSMTIPYQMVMTKSNFAAGTL